MPSARQALRRHLGPHRLQCVGGGRFTAGTTALRAEITVGRGVLRCRFTGTEVPAARTVDVRIDELEAVAAVLTRAAAPSG